MKYHIEMDFYNNGKKEFKNSLFKISVLFSFTFKIRIKNYHSASIKVYLKKIFLTDALVIVVV